MKTVLVVDDEYDLRATLTAILEGEGYATQACSDGREALERLRSARPDLLLMDVMLPRVSGAEVARIIDGRPEFEGLPVVLMSSVPTRTAHRPGPCRAFLQKPFTLSTLLETVEHLIGRPDGR
jgi:twitching motility two-component system response regulator PilH